MNISVEILKRLPLYFKVNFGNYRKNVIINKHDLLNIFGIQKLKKIYSYLCDNNIIDNKIKSDVVTKKYCLNGIFNNICSDDSSMRGLKRMLNFTRNYNNYDDDYLYKNRIVYYRLFKIYEISTPLYFRFNRDIILIKRNKIKQLITILLIPDLANIVIDYLALNRPCVYIDSKYVYCRSCKTRKLDYYKCSGCLCFYCPDCII